jgi:hypothetical protein
MAFNGRQFFKTSDRGNWQDATDAIETGFTFGFYGAFSDYTNQTIASTSVAYPMTLSNTDESFGVRVVSGSRLTFDNPGTYNIQWSGQFDSSSTGAEDVSVWMRRNGTDIVGSTGVINIPSSHGGINGHTLPGWNFVITLTAGEYVEFAWSSSSTSVSLKTYAAGTSPTRPSTASLIVTATQVGAVR